MGNIRDATTIKRRLVFCVRNALRIAKVNVFFSFWRFSCSFAYSLITFDFLSTSNQISHDPRQYVEPFLNVMMCEIEKNIFVCICMLDISAGRVDSMTTTQRNANLNENHVRACTNTTDWTMERKKNCVDCSMRKKAEKNVLQLQRARKKSERMHVGRKKVKEMRGRFVRLIAAFFWAARIKHFGAFVCGCVG